MKISSKRPKKRKSGEERREHQARERKTTKNGYYPTVPPYHTYHIPHIACWKAGPVKISKNMRLSVESNTFGLSARRQREVSKSMTLSVESSTQTTAWSAILEKMKTKYGSRYFYFIISFLSFCFVFHSIILMPTK